MDLGNRKTGFHDGTTLVELVVAVAMVTIIFAAILPQFALIRNSWDTKQGTAEALQNGRVLMDHINRNLSRAVRIIAVSESSVTNGYIEFLDNDGNRMRYDIGATNYVEYGRVRNLADLAGPVTSLQFTCYDACNITTLLLPVSDVNVIRVVKVQSTFVNAAPNGQDRAFTTYAYLRANGDNQAVPTAGTLFEYDTSSGGTPALAGVDSTHYLCAYAGPGSDGFAVVLTVDAGAGTITKGTAFEYDTSNGQMPALTQIDSTHYLCAYAGDGSDGFAVVLIVNTGSLTVSWATPFEYDTSNGEWPALAQIDSTHYLSAYVGWQNDGFAAVLTVNPSTWAVSGATALEYDTSNGEFPAIARVDSTHYVCAYTGPGSDGFAVVLTVNPGTWAVTAGAPLEFDTSDCQKAALVQMDSTHYLCAYSGPGNDGWALILTVNTGTWTITAGTPFEFDASQALAPALSKIDSVRVLCSYTDQSNSGSAVVLNVDTTAWTISRDDPIVFDSTQVSDPALMQIDTDNYLCAYTALGSNGWAVILRMGEGLRP